MDRVGNGFRVAASVAAALAGLAGLAYSVAFVILRSDLLAALMLMLGGLLSVVALVALYELVRSLGVGFATIGLIFAVAGALGAAVHGAYDLANVLHPTDGGTGLPNAVDPRGFLTFGLAGLGVFVVSALALRASAIPRPWVALGVLLGCLLVVIYLGRLIVLDATSPLILAPAALVGFVVNPLWYVWLSLIVRRGTPLSSTDTDSAEG